MASHGRTLNSGSSSRCLLSSVFFFLCSSVHVNCYPGDILKHGEYISRSGTLVSAKGTFELRFFTTRSNTTSPKIFVGICYKWDRDTVVWVANRDKPLPANVTGVFRIAEDGNLKVLDSTGKKYWTTTLESSSSTNRTVKLLDSGNLVLSNDHMPPSLWESFKNPTDTFLSGMEMDENLTLTSWQEDDDPGSGQYLFKQDQQGKGHYVVSKNSKPHWKNGMRGTFSSSNEMPYAVASLLWPSISEPEKKSDLLKNATKHLPTNRSSDFTRLVMNNNGQLQYLTWDERKRNWSLTWSKPEDECDIYNYCGKFGSCNINNWPILCKCLPGFEPTNPVDYWDLRDFSDGCTRNLKSTSNKIDTFLSLKMVKVSNPGSNYKVTNKTKCEKEYCLENSQCVGYSYQEAVNSGQRRDTAVSDNICWIWNDYIDNLQEEYPNQGRDLSVRVAKADLESTSRTCEPCGTYTIPYPLSTGEDCGDPMYFIFDCNASSGQVSFKAPRGTHPVVSINPSARNFVIQVINSSIIPSLNESLPFILNGTLGNYTDQFEGRLEGSRSQRKNKVSVQISWKPPMEPTCTSSTDCKDWPNSTCNETTEGKLRCLCHPNFRWDGSNLNCTKESDFPKSSEKPSTRKIQLPLIVVLPLACVTSLACIIIFMYIRKMAKRQEVIREKRKQALHALDSERHVKDLIDSVGSIEEDGQGIEVPFFDLECILTATNNFSVANRLGQGGYGPVYLGTFPGGQEIAVKRLSSVSRQGLQEFKNEAWRLWEENRVLDSMDQSLRESCNVDQFLKCVNIAFLCVQEDPNDRPHMSNIITMLDSEIATVPTPRQPAFILRKGLSSTASSSSQAQTRTEWTSSLGETSI
ncbi:hypothetical protein I3760_04G119600 [Carya illinoinensis]|uniref:Receptor-like serine/threonine-protein kinase n=1 Tax=Carya illinoinensis TaxID=32201 RepID=A0A922FD51_CARIL|nr:hypothetical protein I3760_04G119600 [Carya illinoinensis]KAG6717812.1 hypothetical protein I3842_04G118300 [Carya illinoinensis]